MRIETAHELRGAWSPMHPGWPLVSGRGRHQIIQNVAHAPELKWLTSGPGLTGSREADRDIAFHSLTYPCVACDGAYGYSDGGEMLMSMMNPADWLLTGLRVCWAQQVEKNTTLTVAGFDKVLVGDFCATIRRQRPPEPYKGKGIRYQGEVIKLKEGKVRGEQSRGRSPAEEIIRVVSCAGSHAPSKSNHLSCLSPAGWWQEEVIGFFSGFKQLMGLFQWFRRELSPYVTTYGIIS